MNVLLRPEFFSQVSMGTVAKFVTFSLFKIVTTTFLYS